MSIMCQARAYEDKVKLVVKIHPSKEKIDKPAVTVTYKGLSYRYAQHANGDKSSVLSGQA